MTDPIEAAAQALRADQRYLTDRPETLAKVAIAAWLGAAGMDADWMLHFSALLDGYFQDEAADRLGAWSDAVRAVEQS